MKRDELRLIKSKIKKIIKKRLKITRKSFSEKMDLDLESVQILKLIVTLEDEYGFTINDDELGIDLFTDLNKISNFVLSKLRK